MRACEVGLYVCVVTCVLACFGISEASPGAAVHPEAPQCLHLQPYTPPDSTFTRLWPWHLPHLSLPSGLTVWLHLLLLKPHRVRDLLKAHTQTIFAYYAKNDHSYYCYALEVIYEKTKHDLTIKRRKCHVLLYFKRLDTFLCKHHLINIHIR